jgi:hypothetical protein
VIVSAVALMPLAMFSNLVTAVYFNSTAVRFNKCCIQKVGAAGPWAWQH